MERKSEEVVFSSAKNLPNNIKDALFEIFRFQGDIEYGSYNIHLPWQSKATSSEDRWMVARIVSTEVRHGLQVTKFLRQLGERGNELADDLFRRKVGDHDFRVFEEELPTWADVCGFSCFFAVTDLYQLNLLGNSKYEPLRKAIPLIMNEESLHPTFGINGFRKMIETDKISEDEVVSTAKKWITLSQEIFNYGGKMKKEIPSELGIKWDESLFRNQLKVTNNSLFEQIGIEFRVH